MASVERPAAGEHRKRMSLPGRMATYEFPTRLQEQDDQEDVTATTTQAVAESRYMNQSVFGLVAATGSRTKFNNERFDDTSDSETDNPNKQPENKGHAWSTRSAVVAPLPESSRSGVGSRRNQADSRSRVARSLAHLPSRSSKPRSGNPLKGNIVEEIPEDMMMSRLLEAKTQFEQGVKIEQASNVPVNSHTEGEAEASESPSSLLAFRLMEMFGLAEPEQVIAEFPCWHLQSVLHQGYLYLTQRHLCFYAYAPRQSQASSKSGYLLRRSKTSSKYRKQWFELKGDVLSFHSSASDRYFPQGNIDLRYSISAELVDEQDKTSLDFSITTDHRTYHFRAESSVEAHRWVRAVQRTIFRSRNEHDNIKIPIPATSILDIEEVPVVGTAETIKVRAYSENETYVIDEYFFSFAMGVGAIQIIRDTFREGVNRKIPIDQNRDRPKRMPEAYTTHTQISIVDPDHPIEARTLKTPAKPEIAHRDSFTSSAADQGTESSITILSPEADMQMSTSQILTGSEIFRTRKLQTMSTLDSDSGEDDQDYNTKVALIRDPPKSGHLEQISTPPSDQYKSAKTGNASISTNLRPSRPATPGLQGIIKVGVYPLQKAGEVAGYLKNQSGKVSKMLASESMTYYEKVAGMWAGRGQHYGDDENIVADDRDVDDEDREANVAYGNRFRMHFSLPTTEKLQATYFGFLHRVIPVYGKIYISNGKFCFRSLLPTTRTKLVLPLQDIENVGKEKGFRFGYHGLVIVIRGHEELFFEFSSPDNRDDCTVTLLQILDNARFLAQSGLLDLPPSAAAQLAEDEYNALQQARKGSLTTKEQVDSQSPLSQSKEDLGPLLFDEGKSSSSTVRPPPGQRITCLTIGSRGDVQPYIALCLGLKKEGHRPKIATHAEFGNWVRSHGIDFVSIGGDPAELMRICVENGMFTYSFLKEASSKFRSWIDDLLLSAWAACQNTDILIESPSAMAGIHIAEALGIPYFRAFTMPWTRTRAYPHAFAVPENKYGGAYNYLSYVMFDNVFWKGIAGQVNRWRRNHLGLQNTSLERMQQNRVPFLYNFSPTVVAPPLDYSDWVKVTGYWFLDEGTSTSYTPPPALETFIKQARTDAKKLVYIGFGSIVVSDPAALTRTVVAAVEKADVRCILSKGWSDRLPSSNTTAPMNSLSSPTPLQPEIPLPSSIFSIKSAPHDYLFARIDAAIHHGGAGTTGASLRAGIPTVTKPFFGDQFFFGSRIEDLGVGICLKKVNVSALARAIWEATRNERMITKARRVGEKIRGEDGVGVAISRIWEGLEYAQELVREKRRMDEQVKGGKGGKGVHSSGEEANEEMDEERLQREIEAWTVLKKGEEDGSGEADEEEEEETEQAGIERMSASIIMTPGGAR